MNVTQNLPSCPREPKFENPRSKLKQIRKRDNFCVHIHKVAKSSAPVSARRATGISHRTTRRIHAPNPSHHSFYTRHPKIPPIPVINSLLRRILSRSALLRVRWLLNRSWGRAASLLWVLDRGLLVWCWAGRLLGVASWLLELLLGVSRWLLLELLLRRVLGTGGSVGSGVLRLLGVLLLDGLVGGWGGLASDWLELVLLGDGGSGGGVTAAVAEGGKSWGMVRWGFLRNRVGVTYWYR